MSLTDKATGKSAAEEMKEQGTFTTLQRQLEEEKKSAELQMLRAMNKELMLKVADSEKWRTQTGEMITQKLQDIQDLTERSLKDLEAAANATIRESGSKLDKAVSVLYGQVIASLNAIDDKTRAMSDANQAFSAAVGQQAYNISNSAFEALRPQFETLQDGLLQSAESCAGSARRFRRYGLFSVLSAFLSALALVGVICVFLFK